MIHCFELDREHIKPDDAPGNQRTHLDPTAGIA